MSETCEYRWPNEDPACVHPAVARVRVGTREYDAQLTCGVHLAQTCMTMAYGDSGLPRQLTVTMLRPV